MKILLISHRPDYIGGIASWTRRMLSLNCSNVEFILVDSSPLKRDAFKETKVSIKNELIRTLRIWKKEIHYLWTDEEIDIVHTNIPCTMFGLLRETVTGMICKVYGKKFVLHCHCTVSNVIKKKIHKIYFRIFMKLCDGVIVLNKQSELFVKDCGGANVRLIPNFVMVNSELDVNKQINDVVKDLVYVGGVTFDKGCDIIIEAASKITDMTFHLVGAISNQIASMTLPPNVRLYGNVDGGKVQEMLKKADVFLFISRFYGEGFSCALTEAMAAGLPCIVSDWAANRDMIEDQGGIVLKEGTVNNLVDAIVKMRIARNDRERMSRWNREKVKNYYTENSVRGLYEEYYQMIAEK